MPHKNINKIKKKAVKEEIRGQKSIKYIVYMITLSPFLWVIILNKWIKSPTKKHRLSKWIKKKKLTKQINKKYKIQLYAVQKRLILALWNTDTESEIKKRIFHTNNTKESKVAVIISDNLVSELKIVAKDKEGYYIMKKNRQKIRVDISPKMIYEWPIEHEKTLKITNQ